MSLSFALFIFSSLYLSLSLSISHSVSLSLSLSVSLSLSLSVSLALALALALALSRSLSHSLALSLSLAVILHARRSRSRIGTLLPPCRAWSRTAHVMAAERAPAPRAARTGATRSCTPWCAPAAREDQCRFRLGTPLALQQGPHSAPCTLPPCTDAYASTH